MMNKTVSTIQTFRVLTILAVVLALAGCSAASRTETAQRLAVPAQMHKRHIATNPFTIAVFERVHDKGGAATIYIEGDGLAWLSRTTPSTNPTPTNPVALHLATRDSSQNVIYMARPCQYTLETRGGLCDRAYWMSKRFAPEVVDSMNAALDDIKKRYDIRGFNLVGYSGGGAVAALLTAERDDVLTLRTVAGNLDHTTFSQIHNISPLKGSLNAADVAARIADTPQRHFVGEWDEVVPFALYTSYRNAAAGNTGCIHNTIVKEATHEAGWVSKWPALLQDSLSCQ